MYRTNPNKIQLKSNPAPKLRTLKRKLIVWWYSKFSIEIIMKRYLIHQKKYLKNLIVLEQKRQKYKNKNDLEIQTKKYN